MSLRPCHPNRLPGPANAHHLLRIGGHDMARLLVLCIDQRRPDGEGTVRGLCSDNRKLLIPTPCEKVAPDCTQRNAVAAHEEIYAPWSDIERDSAMGCPQCVLYLGRSH